MTRERKLPSGWRWGAVADAIEIEAQSIIPQKGTSYAYVGLEHIEAGTGLLVGVREVDGTEIESQKFRFEASHVLYGKLRPYLNKVALPEFEGICSTDILPLRPKASVSREYVAYWLRSPEFVDYAKARASGTKMPRLGSNQLLVSQIPLPSFETQVAIAAILQKADGIRRKRVEARRIAEKLLPTIFLEMFGDPEANLMSWPKKPLEAVSDVRQGVAKGRDLRGREAVKAPYLRVANVQEGYLDLTEVKEIDVLPADLEKYHLERGDVLLTEGGDPDKLGRGFIWNGEIQGCIYQNHIFRVRTDPRIVLPEFLAFLTRTQYAKSYFLKAAKRSSNLASINASQLRALLVPLPPIGMQERFRDAFNAASQRLLAPGTPASAEKLFSRLLAAAFSGELVP